MSATLSTAAVPSPLCVAVTGGGGFVGSALVERLLQQHPSATVVLLDTFKQISGSDDSRPAPLAGAPASLQQRAEEWAAERFGAGWEQRRCVVAVCDICDSASVRRVLALHRPHVVCHLAAEAGVRSCEREPALCQRVNVAGTRVVLQEARACGVQHFLFASSSSVYGRQPAPWREVMTPDPQGEYAASKMQGEALCAAESHRMRVTVLRMFSVYGPRGRTGMLVGACLQAAQQRRLLEINGDGEQQRDNTYIDDAVAGWMAAMEASLGAGAAAPDNPTGNFKIFNLGTGRPCSVNRMVALLEQQLGRRVQRATAPADPADVLLTQADTNLAQRELGFSAHISVKEGAYRCVEHMLASQWNQTVALVATTGTGERWELFVQRCLPAMQRQRWLAGAISSVHPVSLLVVVVDNEESGRVDALRADVTRVQESTPFPIVLLRNWRNKGASGAWNTGLLHLLRMSGERDLPPSHALYVAICDDDDAWEPSHVSVCAAEAARTGADLIVAGLIRCDTSGVTLQSIPSPSEMTAEVLLERNAHVQGSNLFARLDAFAAAGLFDEHLPSCTDRDLLLRMIDIPGFMQRSIAQHTVRHYADDSRLRLSSKGSPAKLLGLTRFWLKHRHRMSEAVAGKCAQRAKRLFGWTPPETAATSTLPPSNDVEVAVAVAPASQHSALPAAGAPSQRPLVVGIVSDSGSARVTPLLQSLHGLGACDFIAGVDVLVLENGPHSGSGALSTAVEQARAGGLRCSLIPIEQQIDDVSAGALPGWVNPSLSRRQSIAESRTCLQYYIARFVRCLEQHTSTKPVAWILDDDKAWEAGEFHSQLTRVWSAAAASDDIAAVFGMATRSPPLPAALVCRTQFVDLVAHLQRLLNTACAEDLIRAQCAVDLADVCRQQPDFYHDLAAGRFGGVHLERPFLDAKQGHSAEAELARLAARLEAVCAGAMPFRLFPATVAESELEHLRPSIHRGGCTLVFQPSALEQVPNTAPVLCGMHTRRSDFVWALLCARMRGRRLLQCRSLLVQHQRAASLDSPPRDAPTLANAVLTDVTGHAVYRALDLLLAHDHRASKLDFSPEHVQLFLGAFGAALSERATLLRASLMRVRALIALAMQLLESTHAWWNRPDEPSILHRHDSARRMTASLQQLRDAYVTERARQSWDGCLAQLVMDGAKEASLRAWLLGLHGELQERQAVMGSEELRAAFEQRIFLPHRQKCAVAALASLGSDLTVKLLGVGYEGVSYLSPVGIVGAGDASSSSSVSTPSPPPPVVLKVLDLFQLRTSLPQRGFLRALMHNDKAKRLLGLRAVHFNQLHRLLIVEKEYVSGEPLSASTKERCESPVRLLHALRAASISCRDLQSKNVIVSDSGTLHLIDVGMDVVPWSEREEQSAMRKLFFSWHWAHRTDVRELMRASRTQLLPEMEAYERFKLALAGPYDTQKELFHWLVQQTHTLCRRRVDTRSPVTILDYGCGDGRLLQLMHASFARENPFVKLVGYDPHEPHLPTDSSSAPELSFTRKAEDLVAVGQRCDVVVCSRVVCCIEDEAMCALMLNLASAVRGSGTVLLALCNPFFTQSGDTPAQRRVLPADFDPLRVCRWTKVVTGTGHERTELHRPMHVLKRELMAAGLEICAVAQTRTADIRDFLPNSDTIMLTVKPFWREEQMRMAPLLSHCQAESDAATRVAFAAGSPPCTLLIKTCVREEAQLYERVTHLVRQLEGPRVFHERLLVVDNKRSHFIREYRSQQLQESDGIETQEERFHAVCKKLLAEQWVDRVLFASSNAVDIRTRNARWFGESNSPHSHTTGGLHVTSTLQAVDEARCSFILQVDSDLLIGRRAPHDYLAEAATILQRDPHAVTLSLNILRSGPLEPSFLNEHGRAHRVEVRGCFFVRERLQQLLPIPRDDSMWERHADGTTQLRTSWYRAMDSALQRNWARSYRGGAAHRTFFVHPPNHLKRELRDMGLLADFVERGWIPSEQIGQVDLQGQLWGEWIGCAPKAVAPFVFVVLGRNVPPSKVMRCLQSVEAADAGVRAHSLPSDVCAWSMVVVDDASTPHHAEQIRLECARLGERVTLVQPRYHRNGGVNTVLAIRHLVSNPDSVVITLDLDDALIGDRLFKHMHQAYHIEGVDCTVGNHLRTDKPTSPPNPYPAMLTHPRRTRGGGNVWKHLRSFRQHLFARIRDEDLRTDRDSREYFTHGADWVLMLPIVEASFHPLELHEKLYLWDPHRHSDANFFQHERRALIKEAVTEIVRKPEYSKLRPIVAVVGDAAYGPEDTRKRLLAEELGRELANAGYCLLTGGLRGCMEFACAGARSTRQPHACTVGLLPGGSPRDSNPFVDVALPTTLSHARNALVAQADALVAVAGGAGTVSELSLAWANGRMCILLAPHLFPHSATTAFAGRTIDQRVRIKGAAASGEFRDCVFAAKSPQEVVQLLHAHLHRYQRRGRAAIKSKL